MAGSSGGLPPFTASKIVQQKIQIHEKKQNRPSVSAWEIS